MALIWIAKTVLDCKKKKDACDRFTSEMNKTNV